MNRLATSFCLAAILMGMAWLNWYWTETPVDLSPIAAKAPAVADIGQDSNGAPKSDLRVDVSEALARPLFHMDRRPFEPPVEPVVAPVAEAVPIFQEAQPQSSPAPELRLAGVSLSGDRKRALLGPVSGTDVRWYSQGDDVGGWIIAAITGDAVTLAAGGSSFVVSLYPAGPEPPTDETIPSPF